MKLNGNGGIVNSGPAQLSHVATVRIEKPLSMGFTKVKIAKASKNVAGNKYTDGSLSLSVNGKSVSVKEGAIYAITTDDTITFSHGASGNLSSSNVSGSGELHFY